MKRSSVFITQWSFFELLVLLLAVLLMSSPLVSVAQSQGNNAVWASSTSLAGSPAFIDASTFYTGSTGPDICQVINGILNSATGYGTYPATGAVIDARGILTLPNGMSGGGSQPCSINPFQSSGGSGTLVSVPSTVLLPASTLLVSVTWVLPSNTKIVGEGQYTTLKAHSFTSGDIVDMCGSSGPCTGVSIEHLNVSGPVCTMTPTSNSLNGIVNNYAQGGSYVNDVGTCDIGLTSLKITSNASNSGPYSNLSLNVANTSSTSCSGGLGGSCPACVDIEAQTKGLHGVTCIGDKGVAGGQGNSKEDAGIYVNYSNNTVEDVHIEAFWDGVEVGDTSASTVTNVVLSNVNGGQSVGPVTNVVHICGTTHPNSGTFGTCAVAGTVTDVTILQATQDGDGNSDSTSVLDDVTGTSIAAPSAAASSMAGFYSLGEQVVSGGYSRFSTSPSATNTTTLSTMVPTWSAGGTMTSITGDSCSTPGSIYSNTDGGSTTSVYVCTYNGTTGYYWQPIV
jgi:hypothetical protein